MQFCFAAEGLTMFCASGMCRDLEKYFKVCVQIKMDRSFVKTSSACVCRMTSVAKQNHFHWLNAPLTHSRWKPRGHVAGK